jgi:C-terminal processing protease CtpA/Prc
VEESIKGKVEEYVVSPDGKKIALIARGEVYLIPSEDPERARRLTHTDARERFARFSPDGKTLFYVSDRTGRQNLYRVDTRSGEELQLTSVTDADVSKPQVSPKGDRVAFYLDNNRIVSISVDGGAIDTILIGRYFDFPLESTQEFKFSPDGNYLAFTAFGTEYNTDIWVHNLTDGRSYNMTRLSRYNYDPTWSPDGKHLTFSHFLRGETQNLYALRLDPEIPEFAESKLDSLYEKAAKKDKDDADQDTLPEVKIDFEAAHQRWKQIYPMTSGQTDLRMTPDGKYWLFVADLPSGNNIWRVPADDDSEDKPLQLTSGKSSKSALQISEDSKWVYFLESGKIGRVGMDGKEQKSLSFAADYDYHTAARQKQKLDEVWRILGNYFYDPQLHGAAWDSLHQVHSEILSHIALEDELRDLIKEFIGSLNASHLNIYGGLPQMPSGSQSGYLGVTWDAEALRDGLYRLHRVLRDGPVDGAKGDAVLGSQLISVNGHMLDSATTLDSLLGGTIGERVRLEFSGGELGAYSLDVKPVSKNAEATLVYEDFVSSRRHFVDSVSAGRLGYLHVRSMNQTGLDRFMRELADQSSSYDGLIIDVRYNGGGWISVHLLGMLQRDPFVLRNFRGAETVSENKNRAFAVEKPMIMLQNHFSASNSEIFAEGWRTLGLGKIVGYPSSAAVIGTSAYRLIDGTICRRPSWGAYALDMENLEGNSRQPDIKVFNTQNDWISGRDPQLKAAIDELLSELR